MAVWCVEWLVAYFTFSYKVTKSKEPDLYASIFVDVTLIRKETIPDGPFVLLRLRSELYFTGLYSPTCFFCATLKFKERGAHQNTRKVELYFARHTKF